MSVTAVVGLGPNGVAITCMLFPSVDAAKAGLLAKGFVESDFTKTTPTRDSWELAGEWIVRTYQGEDLDTALEFEEPDDYDEDAEPSPDDLARKLFTHYYGGCGSCSELVIVQVEYGVPFVGFDLD
jgi:hypothetical protein